VSLEWYIYLYLDPPSALTYGGSFPTLNWLEGRKSHAEMNPELVALVRGPP
jgi:hypothetical protein